MTFENIKDIEAMILSLVTSKIDSGKTVCKDWTVTEILNEYSDIEGSDIDFYRITAREWVYRKVKDSVQKLEETVSGATNPQMLLEGFEYLQKAYSVKRDDSVVLVPIHLLTDEELESRAHQYEEQANTLQGHAREIRYYIANREKAVI